MNSPTKSRITFIISWFAVVERMNIAALGFSLIFGSARFIALRTYPFCFFGLAGVVLLLEGVIYALSNSFLSAATI